jgi:hypothetical protein
MSNTPGQVAGYVRQLATREQKKSHSAKCELAGAQGEGKMKPLPTTKSAAAFRAEIAKQRKAVNDAAVSFVSALQLGDPALFAGALEKLEYNDGWSRAFRGAARLTDVPPTSRSVASPRRRNPG